MKAIILLVVITLTTTAAAQQKRPTTPKPQPKPAAAPTPAPTFETLVPADTYILYGEVRGVGQFIRSSSLNDLLEPVLNLSGPPKEFTAFVKFLNAHSEEVMTSRLLVATWPRENADNVPEALLAIEFPTAEEATKFGASLNVFLAKVLPPSPPEKSAEHAPRSEAEKPKPPTPRFHLTRFGSLVVVTPKDWTMKKLKPAGSKLLAEDVNFRAAHNRFNSEPLFVYFDTKTLDRQEQENRKHWEQQRIEAQKQSEAEAEAEAATKKAEDPPAPEPTEPEPTPEPEQTSVTTVMGDPKDEPSTPEPFGPALFSIMSALDRGESKMPDGVGLALSYEGDSFDLRALLINQTGDKTEAIPFLPLLISGPPVALEAPNIFPADTDLLATMSLDLPQIYALMSKPSQRTELSPYGKVVSQTEVGSPFEELEKRLKINIRDDVLPLLGPEIAVRLPMKQMGVLGLPSALPATPQVTKVEAPANDSPVVAIAIKDREAVKTLMPKLVEAFGFKGANALAQTERREDTEIISYANVFSYAFVGNFLVLSGDPAGTRHVVDSYLKHETLAADVPFRNSTRWQPKPQQGQIYISPSLMESYKIWAELPSTRITEQTRAFLMRASAVAQPITYSLSNEGLGPLHELHIPKNLVLMAVAGISGEMNPPQNIQNERVAIGTMYSIVYAEQEFKKKKGNGSYGTLEQLLAEQMVSKESLERSGYKFELTVTGDKFELSAVPAEYGKSGTLSLFIESKGVLRGADHSGASATAADPPISN